MIHDPDSRQRVIDLVDADPKAIRGRYERMPYGRFAIVSKGKVGWASSPMVSDDTTIMFWSTKSPGRR